MRPDLHGCLLLLWQTQTMLWKDIYWLDGRTVLRAFLTRQLCRAPEPSALLVFGGMLMLYTTTSG